MLSNDKGVIIIITRGKWYKSLDYASYRYYFFKNTGVCNGSLKYWYWHLRQ